jgi:hypothetical protein
MAPSKEEIISQQKIMVEWMEIPGNMLLVRDAVKNKGTGFEQLADFVEGTTASKIKSKYFSMMDKYDRAKRVVLIDFIYSYLGQNRRGNDTALSIPRKNRRNNGWR